MAFAVRKKITYFAAPLLLLLLNYPHLVYSQSLFPKPQSQFLTFIKTCRTKYRTYDGTCNSRFGWGSANRAQSRFTRSNRKEKDRPSARLISNAICHQDVHESILNDRGMSELVTFFGQFVDHTFASTPVLKEERWDIPVPKDDPFFGNITAKTGNMLKFTRSQTVKKERNNPANVLSSYMDASAVYGNSEERAKALRTMKDGLLKMDGDLLPKNNEGIENAPAKGSRNFFLAGDDRSNEHPVLTALHTLFVREHNLIAKEVKEKNPKYEDEDIFQAARKINIGQFQKIVYKEFLPAIMGKNPLRKYRGRKAWVNPNVELFLTTAAFRVGHTLVNDKITKKGPGNSHLPPVSLKNAFFNPSLVEKEGIEPFLRGVVKTKTQEVDTKVVSNLRNFLFTSVEKSFPEVFGFDLASFNIQRGRDHGIGDYMGARARYGLRRGVRDFDDISSDKNVIKALKKVYKDDIRNIDGWVGGLAEKHKPGSSLGPLFHEAWKRGFEKMRDADFYYFEKKGEFSKEEKKMYPRVAKLFKGGSVMRDVILRNTKITETEIQANPFSVYY